MAGASTDLHERAETLSDSVIDLHRALVSLQEELEAVDWYHQRSVSTSNPELAAILAHHRDEEKEHAVMLLEWIRRHDPKFDEHMHTYLFTEESITEVEREAEHGDGSPSADSLQLGSLRGEEL
jgi:ferritin-like protein